MGTTKQITVRADEVRENDLIVRFPGRLGTTHEVHRKATAVSEPWMDRGLTYITISLEDDEIVRNGVLNLAPERRVVVIRTEA